MIIYIRTIEVYTFDYLSLHPSVLDVRLVNFVRQDVKRVQLEGKY